VFKTWSKAVAIIDGGHQANFIKGFHRKSTAPFFLSLRFCFADVTTAENKKQMGKFAKAADLAWNFEFQLMLGKCISTAKHAFCKARQFVAIQRTSCGSEKS